MSSGLNSFIFVMDKGGYLYSCGQNTYGQLGLGNTLNRINLQPITEPSNVTFVSVCTGQQHTIALGKNGILYGCGNNGYGKLANANTGTNFLYLTPLTNQNWVTTYPNAFPISIFCGEQNTFVLLSNYTVWGCGWNSGTLGNPSYTEGWYTSFIPMLIPSGCIPNTISTCGLYSTSVLMTNGEIWSCGQNTSGQFGTGNIGNSSYSLIKMTTVPSGLTPTQIVCGALGFIIVLMNDGSIYGCGNNQNGELGNDTGFDQYNYLIPMSIPTGYTPQNIFAGYNFTIVLMTDGTIFGCGNNQYGQLGNGDNQEVKLLEYGQMIIPPLEYPYSISCGYGSTYVAMTDGAVYSVGENNYGQLGINSTDKQVTLEKQHINKNNSQTHF
jgi:alpha-tubulin suppressor-like RCC1 family protein